MIAITKSSAGNISIKGSNRSFHLGEIIGNLNYDELTSVLFHLDVTTHTHTTTKPTRIKPTNERI